MIGVPVLVPLLLSVPGTVTATARGTATATPPPPPPPPPPPTTTSSSSSSSSGLLNFSYPKYQKNRKPQVDWPRSWCQSSGGFWLRDGVRRRHSVGACHGQRAGGLGMLLQCQGRPRGGRRWRRLWIGGNPGGMLGVDKTIHHSPNQ